MIRRQPTCPALFCSGRALSQLATLLAIIFVGALLTSLESIAAPVHLYVSPHGDDQATGRRSQVSKANDGPMRSVAAALARWRELRDRPEGRHGAVVTLAGGFYQLSEPIRLTARDSGIDERAPLILEGPANGPDAAVLSGGVRLGPWVRGPGLEQVWQASPPVERSFRSLHVNGVRAIRARTPNDGFFRMQGESPAGSPGRFKYRSGDLQPAWAASGQAEVVAFLSWADLRMYLREVDEDNLTAVLSKDPHPSIREANARYFIENAPDTCDAPGEWQQSESTQTIIYRPRTNEDMKKAEVIAGSLPELLELRGDPSTKSPVHHVVLRNLTFSHTDWSLSTNGYNDTQAAVTIRGDVRAEHAVDCVIEDCTFSHLAGYGLELGRGCQRVRVIGNEFVDLGAGGIRVGETSIAADPFSENHSHIITDNHLHQLGRIYAPAVGLFVLQSGTNVISHNHVHDLYYTAVSVGWNWGYRDTPCRENRIEFNHLHDIGQEMLSDMGAIYTLGPQPGTVVRNNLIHDVRAFTYGGWGLYPDEGSSGILWENNVVYRCKSAGFHQHYGRKNIVRNNIFAFNQEHQVMRTREESHLSFYFTNNVVLFSTGSLLGSNWKNERFEMDHNLYWDTRLADRTNDLRWAGVTLEQWRQRGHDVHSIVADPGFVAADHDDFRLRRNSPAKELGFQAIDVSQIGVRPKSRRPAAF